MPLMHRSVDSPPRSLSSTSEYSQANEETSTRPSSARPRSQLLSNFNHAMAWLSRSPTSSSRPPSPTKSAPGGLRSPKSSRPRAKSVAGSPPPSPKAPQVALPSVRPVKSTSDETRRPNIRLREHEQALKDPEIYTVPRAKVVTIRTAGDISPGSSPTRKGTSSSSPSTFQLRTPPKTMSLPRRSSLKRGSHDIPPSPSFPPAIAPFNRLLAEQAALPDFEPQLMAGPPPPGTYSKNSLVTLETSSMTLRTTIDTLTSRPSLLAAYILSICPNPPSGPPKVPSEIIHIFLDRPSQPYHIILAYLRLPRTQNNELPALPRAVQLPPHSQTTSMVGVSKLEALLDLRDEARWLGLEELDAMCETELRNAGLVPTARHATIAEEVEPRLSSESDAPVTPASASSGESSGTPSFSSTHEADATVVLPPARHIPTPVSSDSDATPLGRPRTNTPPSPTPTADSGTTPRARPLHRRQPTTSYLQSHPLPPIPPSPPSEKRGRPVSTTHTPAPSVIPASNPLTSASTASLSEDEKARRAREKLSEALSMRRKHAGSPSKRPITPALASPTRDVFMRARSPSPGRYL